MKKLKKMMEGTSDATELELLKQKKKEYKLALQATKKQENGVKIPSQSRLSPQHELIETEESAPNEGGDEVYTNPSGSVHSHSQQSTGENFPSEEGNDVLINTLKKKLRKLLHWNTKIKKKKYVSWKNFYLTYTFFNRILNDY
mgnify:CR=1 FL=1